MHCGLSRRARCRGTARTDLTMQYASMYYYCSLAICSDMLLSTLAVLTLIRHNSAGHWWTGRSSRPRPQPAKTTSSLTCTCREATYSHQQACSYIPMSYDIMRVRLLSSNVHGLPGTRGRLIHACGQGSRLVLIGKLYLHSYSYSSVAHAHGHP